MGSAGSITVDAGGNDPIQRREIFFVNREGGSRSNERIFPVKAGMRFRGAHAKASLFTALEDEK
jgi:hypothetical protein